MKTRTAALAICLCTFATSFAQVIRGRQYPKVLDDNRVEFRVNAPAAQKVQVDLGKPYDMTKNERGEWSCITEPQTQGFHYYTLIVDGAKVPDPNAESFYGMSMTASGIEIPYPAGVDKFYLKDVPHGDIRQVRYFSKTANAWRRMFVYVPNEYDSNPNKKYPVLYLMHGGGEDERGWAEQGRTDIILDNLIAQGKANPMIIAMLDGNTNDFESELIKDCIPVVEKRFRVKTDAQNRGLAGLSMGGIQTLNTIVAHPELFCYVGVFSSGWFANQGPMGGGNDKNYEALKNRKDYYNKQFKSLWLSMGGESDIAYNNCKVMMKKFDEIGIKYEYFETTGGHTWPAWRESIFQFAQKIFK